MSVPHGLSLAIARAWFEKLQPIPQAFALLDLPRREDVVVVVGAVTTTVTRENAVRMIRHGQVRTAPDDPKGMRSGCPIVVLDGGTGFPVLIEGSRRIPYGSERP